jgi:hypothetical protein
MDPDQTAQMSRLVWIHAGRKPIMLVLSLSLCVFALELMLFLEIQHVFSLSNKNATILITCCEMNLPYCFIDFNDCKFEFEFIRKMPFIKLVKIREKKMFTNIEQKYKFITILFL